MLATPLPLPLEPSRLGTPDSGVSRLATPDNGAPRLDWDTDPPSDMPSSELERSRGLVLCVLLEPLPLLPWLRSNIELAIEKFSEVAVPLRSPALMEGVSGIYVATSDEKQWCVHVSTATAEQRHVRQAAQAARRSTWR